MRYTFFFVVLLIADNLLSQPVPVALNNRLIIDTDCGFDDMRAISIMLSRPEITVRAVITTDGTLPPAEGMVKVASLLREFKKGTIQVAAGETLEGIDPAWRPFNRTISWGSQADENRNSAGATECLLNVLENEKEKITLVCLGPLTNIGKLIRKYPETASGIERIVWYNESVKPMQGFNYECDMENADFLMRSGLRIDVISSLNKGNAIFDTAFVSLCNKSGTELAGILDGVLGQPAVKLSLQENHFRLADDLVALYITNPELFSMTADPERLNIRFSNEYDAPGVIEAFKDMIRGVYVSEHNIVFNRFPVSREMFNYDVRPIIDTVLTLYGFDEWKANVLTDEFHGHLGVFSIVGAKMGIKAREIFGVGPDMLEVTTFAGTRPPYSCLTDGIQVSTGATLGMGRIHLANKKKVVPAAIFTYNNRSVRISLKKEYLDKADADIKEGISKFGLMDDGYWKLIRHSALKYWVEWDRNRIFDIEEISTGR